MTIEELQIYYKVALCGITFSNKIQIHVKQETVYFYNCHTKWLSWNLRLKMANPWIVIYIFVILLRHVFQGETRQGKT